MIFQPTQLNGHNQNTNISAAVITSMAPEESKHTKQLLKFPSLGFHIARRRKHKSQSARARLSQHAVPFQLKFLPHTKFQPLGSSCKQKPIANADLWMQVSRAGWRSCRQDPPTRCAWRQSLSCQVGQRSTRMS